MLRHEPKVTQLGQRWRRDCVTCGLTPEPDILHLLSDRNAWPTLLDILVTERVDARSEVGTSAPLCCRERAMPTRPHTSPGPFSSVHHP